MRKTLKRNLTGSMLLTTAAALVVLFVCLLLGTMRYGSQKFVNEMADVFTADVLTELNAAASGTPNEAAAEVAQAVDAYAGQLRIGAGRNYTIWDAQTGDYLTGSTDETASSVTDNIVLAMNGQVGDHVRLFSSQMDVAIPVSGGAPLVLAVQDDGSETRSLCKTVLLLFVVGALLSLLLSVVLSRLLADAFAASAAQTAEEVRRKQQAVRAPDGDWDGLAVALWEPSSKKTATQPDRLDAVVPYLSEGFLTFTSEGTVTSISEAAQQLLQVEQGNALTFETVMPGVPLPDVTQSMVHGQFTHGGQRLDVVFLSIKPTEFMAIVRPVRGYGV